MSGGGIYNIYETRKKIQDRLGGFQINDDLFLALTDVSGFENYSIWDFIESNDMLALAMERVNSTLRTIEVDLGNLLQFYLVSKMSYNDVNDLNRPLPTAVQSRLATFFKFKNENRNADPPFDAPTIYRRYSVIAGPAASPATFTMPRMALAFPYETAVVRSKNLEECLLPGAIGDLDPILAFPAAPLIIPTTWTRTLEQWDQWFFKFASHYTGFPMTTDQEVRAKQFCNTLKNNSRDCDHAMMLLGIKKAV